MPSPSPVPSPYPMPSPMPSPAPAPYPMPAAPASAPYPAPAPYPAAPAAAPAPAPYPAADKSEKSHHQDHKEKGHHLKTRNGKKENWDLCLVQKLGSCLRARAITVFAILTKLWHLNYEKNVFDLSRLKMLCTKILSWFKRLPNIFHQGIKIVSMQTSTRAIIKQFFYVILKCLKLNLLKMDETVFYFVTF